VRMTGIPADRLTGLSITGALMIGFVQGTGLSEIIQHPK